LIKKFTFYKQPDEMACGATCLRMIAKHYGVSISSSEIVQLTSTTRAGSNLVGLGEGAAKIGLRSLGVRVTYQKLKEDAPLPCIAYWNQNHFIVVYKIHKDIIYAADPAHGLLKYNREEFLKGWSNNEKNDGILLLLEPGPQFNSDNFTSTKNTTKSLFNYLYPYLSGYKKQILQLFIGLIAGSTLQLIFPFLTQSIVDIGVQNKDIHFIYLILGAQLMVFFGRTSIDIIRSYILMHISSRINISITSDFFAKLMRLPIAYFDSKMTGDIMQRINDTHRVEVFLTGSSLSTLFSLFNFVLFSGVLIWYNIHIFLVFLVGSIIYFAWITIFLKYRADLDYKRFHQSSIYNNKLMELINGMQEIKLHNAETRKRWQWESLQVKQFKINLKGLSLSNAQNSGSALINELKNIIITVLAATLVIDGKITLGMMLSISYIVGQLNSPVMEIVLFVQQLQDARLSAERLNEVHNKEDEEPIEFEKITTWEKNADIHLADLSFKYEGAGNNLVINGISVTIPSNKTTAIVGSSGSGKTTLMKLLLKFYEPTLGEIRLEDISMGSLSASAWREKCSAVMQEGYIFNDTIANNIAIGAESVDREKLKHAAFVANIAEFINELPLRYNTQIGMSGVGISTGQKQRMLIARAVYKNPDFLFFDEATSALDANNEKVIMNNLGEFFKGKTVVIIAHRLSTVKNADQIIVLEKGKIIEHGNHAALTAQKGAYYELVKNQLELGN
jgi:ATP-binding cassette, subfamily B, bacterial